MRGKFRTVILYLLSFLILRRALANHVETCVSVILVMMASIIFSALVGYGFLMCLHSHAFNIAVDSRPEFLRRTSSALYLRVAQCVYSEVKSSQFINQLCKINWKKTTKRYKWKSTVTGCKCKCYRSEEMRRDWSMKQLGIGERVAVVKSRPVCRRMSAMAVTFSLSPCSDNQKHCSPDRSWMYASLV